MPTSFKTPSVGDHVLVCIAQQTMPDMTRAPVLRPARVVSGPWDHETGAINAVVFLDGDSDTHYIPGRKVGDLPVWWATSVQHYTVHGFEPHVSWCYQDEYGQLDDDADEVEYDDPDDYDIDRSKVIDALRAAFKVDAIPMEDETPSRAAVDAFIDYCADDLSFKIPSHHREDLSRLGDPEGAMDSPEGYVDALHAAYTAVQQEQGLKRTFVLSNYATSHFLFAFFQ